MFKKYKGLQLAWCQKTRCLVREPIGMTETARFERRKDLLHFNSRPRKRVLFGVVLTMGFMLVDLWTSTRAQEDSKEQSRESAEEILVTGSYIRRKDLNSPAPVTILSQAELEAAGLVQIGDILQNLPSQSNAINVQRNNGGSGSVRVSLRGLGAERTLVLVNGRRHPYGGTGTDSSVDLSAIPSAMIERVEVLKDGASSVYGSDAIGGVVNIITYSDFEDTQATGYVGVSTQGGGRTYDLSVTTGLNSDRGNMVFSANYVEVEPVWAYQRKWSNHVRQFGDDVWECLETGTNAECELWHGSTYVPEGYIKDRHPEWEGNDLWKSITTGKPNEVYSGRGGWHVFDNGGTSDPKDPNQGDLYNYQPETYLYTPSERYSLFAIGRYRFSDKISGYFESSYTNRKSKIKLAPGTIDTKNENILVSADNMYNPFGRDFELIRRRMVEAGGRRYLDDNGTFRLVAGFDGALPDFLGPFSDWHWSTSWQYGITSSNRIKQGFFIQDRLAAALGPSFRREDGTWGCGTSKADEVEKCVPLNFFGGYNQETRMGTISSEMLKYISYAGTHRGFSDLTSITAQTSGSLFEIPFGGPLGLALGYEYREEAGGSLPDPLTAGDNTTGNSDSSVEGKFVVNEFFSELSIPLLSDFPAVDMFELSLSVRTYNYSSFGTGATYKAGARWQIMPYMALRGTYSSAFRAPSISGLYSGQSDSADYVTDPCSEPANSYIESRCRAEGVPDTHFDDRTQILTRKGGNPDLEPETAKIFTVGLVVEPPQIEGLSITLDFFEIEIDNAMMTIGSKIIMNNCYSNQEINDPVPYCNLVIRDNTGYILQIDDKITNIGGASTQGLDFQARYDLQTASAGRFGFNLEGTWLHRYQETQADGTVVSSLDLFDLGVYPSLKANFSVRWGYDNFGVGYNLRYIGSIEECRNNNCVISEDAEYDPNDMKTWSDGHFRRDVDANVTMDLYASYILDNDFGTTRMTVGINNLLDQNPPLIYNGTQSQSSAANYDYMGRFLYFRLAQTF